MRDRMDLYAEVPQVSFNDISESRRGELGGYQDTLTMQGKFKRSGLKNMAGGLRAMPECPPMRLRNSAGSEARKRR